MAYFCVGEEGGEMGKVKKIKTRKERGKIN